MCFNNSIPFHSVNLHLLRVPYVLVMVLSAAWETQRPGPSSWRVSSSTERQTHTQNTQLLKWSNSKTCDKIKGRLRDKRVNLLSPAICNFDWSLLYALIHYFSKHLQSYWGCWGLGSQLNNCQLIINLIHSHVLTCRLVFSSMHEWNIYLVGVTSKARWPPILPKQANSAFLPSAPLCPCVCLLGPP